MRIGFSWAQFKKNYGLWKIEAFIIPHPVGTFPFEVER